jgi:hypothetical protein
MPSQFKVYPLLPGLLNSYYPFLFLYKGSFSTHYL